MTMTPVLGLILFAVFFALMVILSKKLGINIGIFGIIFSFVLAGWFGGVAPNTIVSYFPVGTIASLFCASVFFCYIGTTGLFQNLVHRVLYATRGKTAFIAFAVFLCAALLAAIGGAEASPLIMSPIAFAFVSGAGMNPIVALTAGYFGASFAGLVYWGGGGSAFRSLVENAIGEAPSYTFSFESILFMFVFNLIMLIIFFSVLKGWRMDPDKVKLQTSEMPEPFTKQQKITLAILLTVIAVVVIPTVIQTLIYKNPVTAWLSQHLALKQTCLLGMIALHAFKVVDTQESKRVFKDVIPWGSFISIGGCCMIVQSATALGVTDYLSVLLTDSVPGLLIPAVLVAIAALLSFVSNAFAIIPLFAPMAAALATASGMHEATVCCMIMCGCSATGLSPVSMGGSLWQIGASEEQRENIFTKQWLSAVIVMVAMVIVALLGGFKLIDAIFY